MPDPPENVVDLTKRRRPSPSDGSAEWQRQVTKGDARQRRAIDFPDDWKDLCAEIVRAYRNAPANLRRGDSLGLTELRNLIMRDEDRELDGQMIRSTLLIRQDLQNWLYKGTRPTNMKFWYIDKFVREIQFSDIYPDLVRKISSYREESYSKILSDLYQSYNPFRYDLSQYISDKATGNLYCSNRINPEEYADEGFKLPYVVGKKFSQISMFIGTISNNIAKLIVVYSNEVLTNESLDSDDITVFFGFLIPIFETDISVKSLALVFNRDQYNNIEHEISFPIGEIELSTFENEITLRNASLIDDPMGGNTSIEWKYRGRASVFSERASQSFTRLNLRNDLDKLTTNIAILTNDYLLW